MAGCPHVMCKDKAECEIWPKLSPGSEFPQPGSEINWALTQELMAKPHPLLDDAITLPDDLWGVGGVLTEAKVVHHLLDLAGVPQQYSVDTGDIACRTLVAILGMGTLRERLGRISDWHARETGPAGTVGDYCIECGHLWPCATRQMADGLYADPEDGDES